MSGLTGLLDGLVETMEGAADDAARECLRAVQREIVKRAPVKTGQMRAAFADEAAIGKWKYGWRYGLLTKQLKKRGWYWVFVEYGTKGSPAQVRGKMGPHGRRYRKTKAARKPRPAHPFIRPGVIAAREQFKDLTINLAGVALKQWSKGK